MEKAREAKGSNPCLFLVLAVLLSTDLWGSRAGAFCFQEAGEAYGVSPFLLEAIMVVESQGNAGAINYNSDGSYDFGLMQINSYWAKLWGPEVWSMLGDPCINVYAGAYVLADCIKRFGQIWDAVGCYNARSTKKKIGYVLKVKDVYERLVAGRMNEKGEEGYAIDNREDGQRSCCGAQ